MTTSIKQITLAIVTNGRGEVLLVKRAQAEKSQEGATLKWAFPGGGLEKDEEPLTAVYREVLEETGYKVNVKYAISTRLHPQFPVQITYYSCNLSFPLARRFPYHDPDIQDVQWVPIAKIEDYFSTDFDSTVKEHLETVAH